MIREARALANVLLDHHRRLRTLWYGRRTMDKLSLAPGAKTACRRLQIQQRHRDTSSNAMSGIG
jgi:hypothetical protein